MCLFLCQYHTILLSKTTYSLNSQLVGLFKTCCGSIQILRFFSTSVRKKNVIGHLLGITSNLQMALGSKDLSTLLANSRLTDS